LINVTSTYKLINLLIDGKLQTVKINPSEAWTVMEIETEDGTLTINEGDKISFVTETGEPKQGLLTKIKGKGEKTKLQFVREDSECEEIRSVLTIKEDTLKLVKKEKEELEEEDQDENY
jgi:hypothetical protein